MRLALAARGGWPASIDCANTETAVAARQPVARSQQLLPVVNTPRGTSKQGH